jgi:hypothetical protein
MCAIRVAWRPEEWQVSRMRPSLPARGFQLLMNVPFLAHAYIRPPNLGHRSALHIAFLQWEDTSAVHLLAQCTDEERHDLLWGNGKFELADAVTCPNAFALVVRLIKREWITDPDHAQYWSFHAACSGGGFLLREAAYFGDAMVWSLVTDATMPWHPAVLAQIDRVHPNPIASSGSLLDDDAFRAALDVPSRAAWIAERMSPASLNRYDRAGKTPLMCAAEQRPIPTRVIEALIRRVPHLDLLLEEIRRPAGETILPPDHLTRPAAVFFGYASDLLPHGCPEHLLIKIAESEQLAIQSAVSKLAPAILFSFCDIPHDLIPLIHLYASLSLPPPTPTSSLPRRRTSP